MSSIREWFFGPSTPTASPTPPRPPTPITPIIEKEEHFSGFDPRGLERAAAAVRELEKNALGKDAIALQVQEEKTKQGKSAKDVEEAKAKQQAFGVERARVEGEERRKSIEMEHQANQQQQQYQDQLSRKRHQDQLQAQAAMRNQELKRQEESAMRVEQLKRETAQYEAQLRKETDGAKVEAEIKGRISQERANFDLALQRSKIEAKEYRVTVLEGIREAGSILGEGARAYLSDWQKVSTTAAGFSLLALGIYSAKVSTGVLGKFVEARIGKPPLIRETSRATLATLVRHPLNTVRNALATANAKLALEGVVIEPTLRKRLENLAVSTRNTKKNRAPFRHVLLYGPPGTGKTLFAKKLAHASGMDYAVMTGGDVAPLGRDAVTEIHKLFDWSKASSRGVLIFVDEADAFLRKRTNESMSEDQRNALNAFLYRTGTETKDFMMVFASNLPDELDFAVTDRTDETIEFTLPGTTERLELLKLYFTKYVIDAGKNGGVFRPVARITLDSTFDKDANLEEIAEKIKGFSGREIAKLCVAFQAAAYGTESAKLTVEMINFVVDTKMTDHVEKQKWKIGSEKFGSD